MGCGSVSVGMSVDMSVCVRGCPKRMLQSVLGETHMCLNRVCVVFGACSVCCVFAKELSLKVPFLDQNRQK